VSGKVTLRSNALKYCITPLKVTKYLHYLRYFLGNIMRYVICASHQG